ncbi:hypothetical protein GCM10008106_37100 [Mongoliitalea lutea]|uniref:Uncharacterized protein n=2 Tax=Mongoliitalea lutea TaxID=849756 RepID=A0A8J3D4G5_9BACT|nr:hypothetical protein GCM10008106_37100 [Mongoliitalea lutea]
MRAKIDGELFEVKGELFCTYVDMVSFNIQSTKINGIEGITLTIFPSDIRLQNYIMQQTDEVIVAGQYFKDDASYATIHNPNGRITITAYDPNKKIVEGTFEFVGKDLYSNATKNITEGKFRCRGLN